MTATSANGTTISFDQHGTGDRGTVLLICGTGQPAAMWAAMGPLAQLTDAGFQVVTFDNRGMAGAACPVPPWTVGDMADDAIAVLEAVGPAHVLGVSLGALITQTVALRRPDLVRTAVFTIGGGQFGPAWRPIMAGVVELHATGVPIPAGIEQFIMLRAMLTPEQQSDPELVDFAMAMAGALTEGFGPGGQYGQYSASATWITEDHMSELAAITMPVLVVAHEHDPCFPPSGLRAVAAAVPDGTYVETPGVSHVALDPATLQIEMDAVLKFLAAHEAQLLP